MSNIVLAKKLLEWKQQRLNTHSQLTRDEIAVFFADHFQVVSNDRHYEANYDNYLEFLNGFKKDVNKLYHSVYEYHDVGGTIIMPMRATIDYVNNTQKNYEAIMLLTYNPDRKITKWHEVCAEV